MGLAETLNIIALLLGSVCAAALCLRARKLVPRAVLTGFAFGYVSVYASALLYLIAAGSDSLLPVIDQSRVPLALLCGFAFFSALSDIMNEGTKLR